ncbi:MAG: hypothetical protein FJZ01_28165 [Candidatus Sericytochromatia bacterium]|nr:hypothetical protein [Candidatus Tanganyikabacteria bacterium]
MDGRIRTTLAALVLLGCSRVGQVPGLENGGTPAPVRDAVAAAVAGDAGLPVDGGEAGILGKHSSKFLGTVSAPPGILGKHSSKYAVTSFGQSPYANGLVVLTRPDGMYLLQDGKPITATTDDSGRYDFGDKVIPAGQDILVTATFPGNRLLFQYAHATPGDNEADVDAAGTYVTAYLVARSNVSGRELRSYDHRALPALRRQTAALLESGELPFDPDHFMLGRESALVDVYAATQARVPALAQAWAALLGH